MVDSIATQGLRSSLMEIQHAVGLGWNHWVILDAQGRVLIGTNTNTNVVHNNNAKGVQVQGVPTLQRASVCASVETMFVLDKVQGIVYSFASALYEREEHNVVLLGRSDPTHSVGQVEFTRGAFITSIASGWHHCLALDQHGVIHAWGEGTYYALGTGGHHSMQFPIPIHIAKDVKIVQVSCGSRHSVALSACGDVYTWGTGSCGRLGSGSTRDRPFPHRLNALGRGSSYLVVQVSAGASHTLALCESGCVFSWGSGSYGKLGHGSECDEYSPILVEGLLKSAGGRMRLCEWVSAGEFHSLCVVGGSVFGWGSGRQGQLGSTSSGKQLLPVVVHEEKDVLRVWCGLHCSVLLHPRGTLTWLGRGSSSSTNSILLDTTELSQSVAKQRAQLSVQPSDRLPAIAEISAGAFHTLARTGDGVVYGWGKNASGQLGLGLCSPLVKVPVEIPLCGTLTRVRVQQVACGDFYSLVLGSGSVWAWGDNSHGQLALGSDALGKVSSPTLVKALQGTVVQSVSAGAEHSAAISDQGQLFTWGCFSNGRLGLGQVDADMHLPRLVSLPPLSRCASVSLGSAHSLVLSDSAELFVCGSGAQGQLGTESDKELWSFKDLGISLPAEDPREDEEEQGKRSRIVAGCAGGNSSLCVFGTGEVMVWGSIPGLGQLNRPVRLGEVEVVDSKHSVAKWVAQSNDSLMILRNLDQVLLGWGRNTFGKLGVVVGSSVEGVLNGKTLSVDSGVFEVAQICSGRCHSVLLSKRGEIMCWGQGVYSPPLRDASLVGDDVDSIVDPGEGVGQLGSDKEGIISSEPRYSRALSNVSNTSSAVSRKGSLLSRTETTELVQWRNGNEDSLPHLEDIHTLHQQLVCHQTALNDSLGKLHTLAEQLQYYSSFSNSHGHTTNTSAKRITSLPAYYQHPCVLARKLHTHLSVFINDVSFRRAFTAWIHSLWHPLQCMRNASLERLLLFTAAFLGDGLALHFTKSKEEDVVSVGKLVVEMIAPIPRHVVEDVGFLLVSAFYTGDEGIPFEGFWESLGDSLDGLCGNTDEKIVLDKSIFHFGPYAGDPTLRAASQNSCSSSVAHNRNKRKMLVESWHSAILSDSLCAPWTLDLEPISQADLDILQVVNLHPIPDQVHTTLVPQSSSLHECVYCGLFHFDVTNNVTERDDNSTNSAHSDALFETEDWVYTPFSLWEQGVVCTVLCGLSEGNGGGLGSPLLIERAEKSLAEVQKRVQKRALDTEQGIEFIVRVHETRSKLLELLQVLLGSVVQGFEVPSRLVVLEESGVRLFRFAEIENVLSELRDKLSERIQDNLESKGGDLSVQRLYNVLLPNVENALTSLEGQLTELKKNVVPKQGGSGWVQTYRFIQLRRKGVLLTPRVVRDDNNSGFMKRCVSAVRERLWSTGLRVRLCVRAAAPDTLDVSVCYGNQQVLDSCSLLLYEVSSAGEQWTVRLSRAKTGRSQDLVLVFRLQPLRRIVTRLLSR